ncbi:MAG: patatin-like phospholipase family protein [Phaeodactylibacter sp.]|nr:patatin-like phospholipase family protein [Phaeodactylibacter sp.]MCB9276186.1 patatin-like phospholipase family protein [Lewinellaceae bacterium]
MKEFKILAIDGGGIKGLYSATILRLLEEKLQQEHGPETRVVDYFDLICGTSTGGLIALGLSLRVPMATICSFYEDEGPGIFPNPDSKAAFLRQTLLSGKYSDGPLKAALQKIFGDKKLGESHCLLCIPSFDFTNGTYAVFRYDHSEGNLNRHNKIPYIDIALATSAAPTYFPLAQIGEENNTQYVDGGVWANNPALVGLIEAMRYFVGEGKAFQKLRILSVASLNIGMKKEPLARRERSFRHWVKDLFELGLIGQSEFCDYFLHTLTQNSGFPLDYTRIPSHVISGEHASYISLDNAGEKSLALMKQLGTDMAYKYGAKPEVQAFFQHPKLYRTR